MIILVHYSVEDGTQVVWQDFGVKLDELDVGFLKGIMF
jgi:hypothetical protein